MPRKNRRYASAAPRPLPRDGSTFFGTRSVDGPGGETYLVRQIGASAARKFYVCPSCHQNIPPGVAHIVAWPEDRGEYRRHWHRQCWERR